MSFRNLVNIFLSFVGDTAVILIGILVLIFIYKIIRGMAAGDSKEGRKSLRESVIFGIIGLFFAVSFFAIARVIANSLGI